MFPTLVTVNRQVSADLFINYNIPEIVKTSQPPIVEEIYVINTKQKLQKKNTGK